MNLDQYLKAKKLILEFIDQHEMIYPQTKILLEERRDLWDNYTDEYGRKVLSYAAKAHISMGKIPRESRFEIWSDIFGRKIESAKELKLSEAIALHKLGVFK